MNKIEAAEALAEAVERHRSFCEDDGIGSVAVSFNTLQEAWKAVGAALATYRSASVPSDEDLGRVAYEGAYASCAKWDDVPKEYGRLWTDAAAAVREWVQRDGLTEEERQYISNDLTGHPQNVCRRIEESILRKLGPEPVWEWDEANATMTLGGKFSDGVFPCAAVSLFYGGGLLCRIHLSEMKELHQVLDNYAESLEWCEQQLREARQ